MTGHRLLFVAPPSAGVGATAAMSALAFAAGAAGHQAFVLDFDYAGPPLATEEFVLCPGRFSPTFGVPGQAAHHTLIAYLRRRVCPDVVVAPSHPTVDSLLARALADAGPLPWLRLTAAARSVDFADVPGATNVRTSCDDSSAVPVPMLTARKVPQPTRSFTPRLRIRCGAIHASADLGGMDLALPALAKEAGHLVGWLNAPHPGTAEWALAARLWATGVAPLEPASADAIDAHEEMVSALGNADCYFSFAEGDDPAALSMAAAGRASIVLNTASACAHHTTRYSVGDEPITLLGDAMSKGAVEDPHFSAVHGYRAVGGRLSEWCDRLVRQT